MPHQKYSSNLTEPTIKRWERPKVGVLIGTSRGYARSIISGIVRYSQRYGPWDFVHEPELVLDPQELHVYQEATGFIAEAQEPAMINALLATGKPTVIVSGQNKQIALPRVVSDSRALGHMAMDYLGSLGFEQFAFVGNTGDWFAQERQIGCMEASPPDALHNFYVDNALNLETRRKSLADWLISLPKPVGLFASSLIDAREVMRLCAKNNILVPEQVSVLGVDHDTVLCQLGNPPLSSINQGTRQMGYEAARLLDRLMAGETVSLKPVVIPPVGVESRQSTDTLAVRDPNVARAIRLIRRHAADGLTVPELLKQLPVCRRTLELQFRRILGRTLHQEIIRIQIERAKELLLESEMSLVDISVRCGFSHASQLTRVFKKHTGLSPKAFRLKHRF